MSIICDRCGREMNDRWQIDGMPGDGGNCTDCGDNLCAACGGKWGENGECELCSMTLEELEFSLPLKIQRKEKREMPCPNCKVIQYRTANYEQRIWRSDDHGPDGRHKTRRYEISFVQNDSFSAGKKLFETNRYYSFREALIEAHKTLDRMGLNKPREIKRNAD